jgi:hypothetical protein
MLTTAAMLAAVGTSAIVANNLANQEASKVVFLKKIIVKVLKYKRSTFKRTDSVGPDDLSEVHRRHYAVKGPDIYFVS